jgi:hypothetical protein
MLDISLRQPPTAKRQTKIINKKRGEAMPKLCKIARGEAMPDKEDRRSH